MQVDDPTYAQPPTHLPVQQSIMTEWQDLLLIAALQPPHSLPQPPPSGGLSICSMTGCSLGAKNGMVRSLCGKLSAVQQPQGGAKHTCMLHDTPKEEGEDGLT